MNWKAYFNGFEQNLLLEKSLSDHSVEAYMRDLQKLYSYLEIKGMDVQPMDLSTTDIENFLIYLAELGLNEKSRARVLSGIKAFYKYLLMEDVIDSNPTELIQGPRLARKLPDVLSYEEIQQILDAIDLSHETGQRNKAILETLYASGLRVSELTNLKFSDYFADKGFLRIIGKNDKERLVPIGESAIHHINVYVEGVRQRMNNIKKEYSDHIFLNRRGAALSRVMIFNVVKSAVANAGIDKNISPHTFRHSFATHLVEAGADLRAVQEMLGHESILTTEIYTHLDTSFLRKTIEQFHPLNKNKK